MHCVSVSVCMCVCVCIYEVSLFLSYLGHICYKLTGKDSSTNRKHFVIHTWTLYSVGSAQTEHVVVVTICSCRCSSICSCTSICSCWSICICSSYCICICIYCCHCGLVYILTVLSRRRSETRRNPSLQKNRTRGYFICLHLGELINQISVNAAGFRGVL